MKKKEASAEKLRLLIALMQKRLIAAHYSASRN
jgi:hypothetical protein